ncbi:MAG: metallophosphoesterase [Bacteroidota bacterium]
MKIKISLLALTLSLSSLSAQNKKASDDFVVKPYLQIGVHPSPQSLQLLWQSIDTSATWQIEHKVEEKGSWKKKEITTYSKVLAKGIKARRVYHAALTDLIPGSVFNYRVIKNGKVVFMAEAKAPKNDKQSFRFVAFGDIGAGTLQQKLLANRAAQLNPDLVIVPGDIVYERGLISEYDKNFWPIYNTEATNDSGAAMLRSVPFVSAPGNHDTDTRDLNQYPDALSYYLFWEQPLNGPLCAEGGPFVPKLIASDENRKPFIEGAGDAYPRMTNYSFDYGNAHWTIIDSNPYVDFTDTTLNNWVARDLAAAKNAAWRFIVFHHPGFNSAREHYEQQQMRLLTPIFETGKVDVVFNGHVHNYQRTFPMTFVPDKKGTLLVGGKEGKTPRGRVVNGKWKLDKTFDGKTDTTPEGIVYVITGAGGQSLYNPEQNNDPDSWQKFTDKFVSNIHSLTIAEVDGNKLTIRQVTAEGKEVDAFIITK